MRLRRWRLTALPGGPHQLVTTRRHGGPATSALIGRDEVLGTVVGALTQGSAIVVVEGEAGIGKTRLVREAVAAVDGADRVLLATCPAVPEPAPLGGVVTGVRRLRPRVGELGLSPLAGALRPLFPEWTADLPPAPEPLEEPSAVRHLLFRALSELIEVLGVEILVVEDVHWADTATLEWLLTLCADPPADGRQQSIVVSFRPWEVPDGSLLPRLTARTPAGRSRVRVELKPLDAAQIRHLVGSMFATDDVSEQFAEFLRGATDGIPLVVEEYLLLLEDREDIIRTDGGWHRRTLNELEVPATVRESVLERTHRLDPDTRHVLDVASILAEPADEALLAAAADIDEDAVRTGLAGALGSGLLRERSTGLFAFRHVLDAQAISDAVPASERRRLHNRAAAALGRGDHPPVARLAHHARESGDTEAWRGYAEASADLALRSGDDRTAVETLVQVMDATTGPTDDRVRLARTLGQAAFFGAAALGELTGQVVRVLRDVLDAGDLTRPDRGELRLLLGRMLWAVGDKPASFEQWEAAVPDLDHRPDLAIRAMANMALPLISTWPASRHRYWLDRAGELADRAAPADRHAYLSMRVTALLLLGDDAGWDALAEVPRSVSTPEAGRDLAATLVNAAWAMLVWGRLDDARGQLAIAQRHIRESEYSRLVYQAQTMQAFIDWYAGDWAGLRARAADLADMDGIKPTGRLQATQLHGLLTMADGDLETAERLLRDVVAEYGRLDMTDPADIAAPAAQARILLAAGDPAAALAITEPVVAMAARKGVWVWLTDIAPAYVDALIGVARTDAAEAFVARFAVELAGRAIPAPAAAVVTCGGIMADVRGDVEQAARMYTVAAGQWAALPRPYDELLCRERLGRALLAAGERDEAVAVLAETQRRLHDLGARWDADRVARVVRDHGGEVTRTWRGGRRGYGVELSPRELDVVRLVARGMTNRQVAADLFLSTRTVEGHVTSAMRKLEATSRTALAVAAVEAGYVAQDADTGATTE